MEVTERKSSPLALSESHFSIVIDLIEKHLPKTQVWAYGSRVSGKSRPSSDLDLVVFIPKELKNKFFDLVEAFDDSDLPFRVDLFIWEQIPENFKTEILSNHLVLQTS